MLQGGLLVEMPSGAARDARDLQLGYAARVTSPNGSRVYGRYGGIAGGGSGPQLEHELLLMTNAYLPRHADQGLALTYLGADDGGGSTLRRVGLGWLGTWHAFATRQLFNPPTSASRLGLAYMSSGDVSTFQYSKQIDAIASGTAGLDVAVLRSLTLRLGVALRHRRLRQPRRERVALRLRRRGGLARSTVRRMKLMKHLYETIAARTAAGAVAWRCCWAWPAVRCRHRPSSSARRAWRSPSPRRPRS